MYAKTISKYWLYLISMIKILIISTLLSLNTSSSSLVQTLCSDQGSFRFRVKTLVINCSSASHYLVFSASSVLWKVGCAPGMYCLILIYPNNKYWQKQYYLSLHYLPFPDTWEDYISLLLGCVTEVTFCSIEVDSYVCYFLAWM